MDKHPISIESIQVDRWIMPLLLPLTKYLNANTSLDKINPITETNKKYRKTEELLATLLHMRVELYKELLALMDATTTLPIDTLNNNIPIYDIKLEKYKRPLQRPQYIEKMNTIEFQSMVERCWTNHDQYLAVLTLYLQDIIELTNTSQQHVKYYLLNWCSSASTATFTLDEWKYERSCILYNMIILGFEIAGYQLRKHTDVSTIPIIITKEQETFDRQEHKLTKYRFLRTIIQDHFLIHPNVPSIISLYEKNIKEDINNESSSSSSSSSFDSKKIPKINDVQLYKNLQSKLHDILPNEDVWRILYDFVGLLIQEWSIIRCYFSPKLSEDTAKNTLFDLDAEKYNSDNTNVQSIKKTNLLIALCNQLGSMTGKCKKIMDSIIVINNNNSFNINPNHGGFILHIFKYVAQAPVIFKALRSTIRLCIDWRGEGMNNVDAANINQSDIDIPLSDNIHSDSMKHVSYWFKYLKSILNKNVSSGIEYHLITDIDNGEFLNEYIKMNNQKRPIYLPKSTNEQQYKMSMPMQLCDINWSNYIWLTRLRHELDPSIIEFTVKWVKYVHSSMVVLPHIEPLAPPDADIKEDKILPMACIPNSNTKTKSVFILNQTNISDSLPSLNAIKSIHNLL